MLDRNKFKEYYEEYMPQVYGYIYMRTGRDKDLAEDLVSEVFMKALEKLHLYSEQKGGSFRAWVFRITKNHLIDHYRSSKRKQTSSLDELENVAAGKANVEADAKKELEKEELSAALEYLSEDKKELVIMKYLSGYSYKEMAEIVGENENKIRVKTFRAIKDLKRKLYSLKYAT